MGLDSVVALLVDVRRSRPICLPHFCWYLPKSQKLAWFLLSYNLLVVILLAISYTRRCG